MLQVRKAEERGGADYGWLDTRYTFSFSSYYDPAHMGFRALRVINEDKVAPGGGFPTHGHRDMEILTWVLEGSLAHKDSLGTGSVIRPGELQRMSAGTGVTHSEYNGSRREALHLLQIWIVPDERGLAPGYEQKAFPEDERRNRLRLLASRDGAAGSLTVHQDMRLYAALLDEGAEVSLGLPEGRHAWVHVARGALALDGQALNAGDGVAVRDASTLRFVGGAGGAEVLVFDLA